MLFQESGQQEKGIPKEWADVGNTGDTHSTREGIREGKERGKGVFAERSLRFTSESTFLHRFCPYVWPKSTGFCLTLH